MKVGEIFNPRDFIGYRMPTKLASDTRLTSDDKIIYTVIISYYSTDIIDNQELAKLCGVTISTVEKSLKRLRKLNAIYQNGELI